ncbi:MAG TPA: aspartate carbamoyltransferase catalytic subunit [Virgibacillus sp.]|nr:aspartate carbamoyltransferase catalytic subunit [Virgibacillus sp.]
MKHLMSVKSLTRQKVFSLFKLATKYQQNNSNKLDKQLFVANLFFESSTRTKMSFTVAQKKLGLDVLDFSPQTSSMTKGESLYDTAKTFESIGAQMLVIRHSSNDWMKEIQSHIHIPIVNAGAGAAEHPTQSLLDAYTIYQEFGYLEDVNVVIVGDIKHSRVARSNALLLSKLGANVYFSAPPQMTDTTLKFPNITIDEAVKISDCIMLLRVQYERHEQSLATTNFLEKYGLTIEREKQMNDHAIILHPAPVNRGVEIDSHLVECDRSRIFKQMTNGVYIRMAIMSKLLNKWGLINENFT